MMHEDTGTKGSFDPRRTNPPMEGGKRVMAEVNEQAVPIRSLRPTTSCHPLDRGSP